MSQIKITILYDNTSLRSDLMPDWGFSCFIETQRRNILYDAGAKGSILLGNMKKLHIDPSCVEDVFISHFHFDHIGGLSTFLETNSDVRVYAPVSLRGIRHAREVIYLNEPAQIFDGIFSTGELEHIEQSMAVKTKNGLVLISGCSHPGMKNLFKAASQFGKVNAIVGGLHGFKDFELFRDLDLICPTHCTQYKEELKKLYPDKYIEGGVGRVIEI